jgi:hypothetical protein
VTTKGEVFTWRTDDTSVVGDVQFVMGLNAKQVGCMMGIYGG